MQLRRAPGNLRHQIATNFLVLCASRMLLQQPKQSPGWLRCPGKLTPPLFRLFPMAPTPPLPPPASSHPSLTPPLLLSNVLGDCSRGWACPALTGWRVVEHPDPSLLRSTGSQLHSWCVLGGGSPVPRLGGSQVTPLPAAL